MRVGSINRDILDEIKKVRRTGFTIAPEAGTTRLRNVINKDFTEDEYEETLEILFNQGWRNIKLYFMIGLPTETEEDINGIIDMVNTALKIGRTALGKVPNINVGISVFVPKPHTPFQWHGQLGYDEVFQRYGHLKNGLRRKGVNLKCHDMRQGMLEAIFSRGDERSALLLEEAHRKGCRFDAWSDMFDFDRWLHSAEKIGIDLFKDATKGIGLTDRLPWQFIDTGIKRESLIHEYEKALKGEITEDCRKVCYACGLGCNLRKNGKRDIRFGETTEFPSINIPSRKTQGVWYRIRYSKKGILRYLSHQELITTMMRAIRRLGMPILYTSGFHPHPVASFGPPLPVGVEGLDEYFDLKIHPVVETREVKDRLNSELPHGLEIIDVMRLDNRMGEEISCFEYEVMIERDDHIAIRNFMNQKSHIIMRDGREIDIKEMIKELTLSDNTVTITLIDREDKRVRLFEVLQGLFSRPLDEVMQMRIKRTGIYGYNRVEGVVKRGKVEAGNS
ncbi:MAG: hypothetical protein Fur0020_15850 [Thermodesulfovibrionia bacterium]